MNTVILTTSPMPSPSLASVPLIDVSHADGLGFHIAVDGGVPFGASLLIADGSAPPDIDRVDTGADGDAAEMGKGLPSGSGVRTTSSRRPHTGERGRRRNPKASITPRRPSIFFAFSIPLGLWQASIQRWSIAFAHPAVQMFLDEQRPGRSR